ncbi:MAG: methyltransferase domain-containing protein [Bdellovibrionota bacterium]|nr:methyltransferase domain-containing protein [Bdellovibrionota bacterium]
MKMISLSFRRYYLDYFLLKQDFYGDVIDIGGKKANTRGAFKPPMERVSSWKFCNIDPNVEPDYLCSAAQIPTKKGSFDIGLLCEVIEHLENPKEVLKESFRIIKPSGKLIGSVPFMYPKHADPFDFQRWTEQKLILELQEAGFQGIKVYHMGGTLAVVWDMLRIKFESGGIFTRLGRLFLKTLSFFILIYYRGKEEQAFDNTSGFFFIAKRG